MPLFPSSRLRARSLFLALGLALVCACNGSSVGPPVRIGVGAWPGAQALTLAAELEYFEEEGVPVQLVELDSVSDARTAFENGQLDGMTGTQVELLHVRDGGARTPRAVFVTDHSHGGHVLLSRKEVGRVRDLAGKRVAVEHDSAGLYLLGQLLESKGLVLGDVKLEPMNASAMTRALRKELVDAVVVTPPVSVGLRRDDALHVLGSSADVEGEILGLLMFDADFLREHTDYAARILHGIDRARSYAKDESGRSTSIMADRMGISKTDFLALLQDEITLLELEVQPDLMKAGGRLEQVLRATYDHLVRTEQISNDRRTVPTWHRVPAKRALKMGTPR